jgi:hypothetical protein
MPGSQFPGGGDAAYNRPVPRMSAKNLLDGDSPFDPSGALPSSTELLYSYTDAFEDDGEQEGDDGSNQNGRPAPLTVIPTTTTNPERPRTLAAGYDFPRRTLTVLFRDGVLYNYYSVEMKDWMSFKSAFSKGVWLRNNLETRGPGAGGEKVSGGQASLLASAIAVRAAALQQSRRGKQRTGFDTGDPAKVSGYRRDVLKRVKAGQRADQAQIDARKALAALKFAKRQDRFK